MSTRAESGQEFLEHYGVRGMKWGQRKDTSPTETAVKETLSRRGKTKLKTEGGSKQPATEDAIKAALTKQKMKESGTAALSNKELKDLSERMQLEVNVKRLDAETSGGGKKFVKELVTQQGKRKIGIEATRLVDEQTKKKK